MAGARARLKAYARLLLRRLGAPLGRVAPRVFARLEPPPRRATPRPPLGPGRVPVRIVVMHAWGMGGTVRTTLNLAGQLAATHDVEIVSLVRGRRDPFFAFPPGVRVTALWDRTRRVNPVARAVRRLVAEQPSALCPPEDWAYPNFSLLLDLLLYRSLRTFRSGVLVTTRPGLNVIAARFARPEVTVIGQEHQYFARYRPSLRAKMGAAYGRLDVVATLTESDARDYREVLVGTPTRVVRIPNAVPPLDAPRARLEAPVAVAAGRITLQKGFDLLVPAFATVAAAHPGWTLRIYGDGGQRAPLTEQVAALGLQRVVLLEGPTKQLGARLSEASMFVLSSRFEGFGMVLIEAMSLGLPVVAFACPRGPKEIVTHEVDGLLVRNGDVDALAAAMVRLIEDPALGRRLGEEAVRTAARYGLAAVGQQWEALLRELA